MKSVLVVGLGRFGRHVCRQLNSQGHQVMAVDKLESRVDAVLDYVTSAQIGNAASSNFVKSLGVRDFDICYVCIGDDFQNSLEVTSLLKEQGAPMVISRAARDVHAKFLSRNGADAVIYPERQIAKWAAIRYSSQSIVDYIEMDDEHSIFEVKIPEKWVGKSIGQIDIRRRYNINILGLKNRNQTNLALGPETVMTPDWNLLILGKTEDIMKCFKL